LDPKSSVSKEVQVVSKRYRNFLIGVTRFFRDPEAFEDVKKVVIPSIFKYKP
jgi:two-component system CheB/CheR fusion protein